MADLKRKFLGAAAAASDRDNAGETATAAAATDEGAAKSNVKVFQVRSKSTPADPADDPGPRTIIADENGPLGSRG
jgi:hypothetical protein